MDVQTIINAVAAIAGFLSVFVITNLHKQVNMLDAEIRKLPLVYVIRDDYRTDIGEIKATLKHISDKLDAKADK
jgi:cell fate (sporulation/competence/biofilm development) regulator YmcA (YheA/YmcA/DUF963 family)